ncbi:unnamed protein product [Vicia faba]|uniref:Uncharacterized protein n=1 Tax=Vicia faba TaxID=3906 RepID=A0AAV0ZDU4_VICFA|nr:unnamed protein product [Vicia faba]
MCQFSLLSQHQTQTLFSPQIKTHQKSPVTSVSSLFQEIINKKSPNLFILPKPSCKLYNLTRDEWQSLEKFESGGYSSKNTKKRFECFVPVLDNILEKARQEEEHVTSLDPKSRVASASGTETPWSQTLVTDLTVAGEGRGSDYYMEPDSPPDAYRASTLKLSGEDSTGDFSPGLLDLHSFDTELLTEIPTYDAYESNSLYCGRRFDNSEPYMSKQTAKTRASDNAVKSIPADKEKSSSVAKIKVLVCKRPLNNKELAKNEEDIIETYSNSMTVHETKLKVNFTNEKLQQQFNQHIFKMEPEG